jgi:hypothetical protein
MRPLYAIRKGVSLRRRKQGIQTSAHASKKALPSVLKSLIRSDREVQADFLSADDSFAGDGMAVAQVSLYP